MESPKVELVQAIEEHAALLALCSQRAYEKASEDHEHEVWGPRGYKSAKDQLYYIDKLETYSIVYDEIIVGGLVISDNGFGVKEIVRIFVDPDFQGNGIGSATLSTVMEISEAKAWTGGSIKWNTANQGFLEKNGFKRVGEITGDEPYVWYQKTLVEPDFPSIKELDDSVKRVIVEGEIVEKAIPREVRARRGWQSLIVTEATLKDESDDVVLMLWNEQIKQCKVGDHVRIEGGYVKNYRGMRQLNVGKTGSLITLD
ncbi:MAG: GNAT family N-acetyltransferase [Candidatus Bathyarchaeota archaeon]|nr:GNAT family N-acetyltransferase [Candidatus Bathyarchaeota archaeon]